MKINPLKLIGYGALAGIGWTLGTAGFLVAVQLAVRGVDELTDWRDKRRADREEDRDRAAYFEAEVGS